MSGRTSPPPTTASRFGCLLNGSEEATTSATTAPTAGSSPLHIGRDYGDNGFQGNIDDVRIYRRALGADEVLALAHGEDVPG